MYYTRRDTVEKLLKPGQAAGMSPQKPLVCPGNRFLTAAASGFLAVSFYKYKIFDGFRGI